MSWVEHVPHRDAAFRRVPVAISVSKPGRFRQRVYLTVQPAMLQTLLWWRNKAPVRVEIGQGEHAGRMRLTRGGAHTIMGATGKNAATQANGPSLQIYDVPGMPESGLARVAPAWEILDGALIVTLPWAATKGVTKPIAAPPATSQAAIEAAEKADDVPINVTPERPAAPAAADEERPSVHVPQVQEGAGPVVRRGRRPAAWLLVLRKLQAAGGTIKNFKGLTHAECKVLRECEDQGLTEWINQGQTWRLTPAGATAIAGGGA